MQTIIIVAMTPEGLIGKGGKLPWHIPADLKHFKDTTQGHAVLMGRKTFDSIVKPLPRRRNIVITRNPESVQTLLEHPEMGLLRTSLDAVSSLQEGLGLCRARNEEKAFVVGGAQIYSLALVAADEMLVTWVRQPVSGGDTFFPEWTRDDWEATPLPNLDGLEVVSYKRRR